MANNSLCLSVILVMAVIIIAYFAWRLWMARRGEKFSYMTPAAPRVNEAVGELFAELRRIVDLGREFDQLAAEAPQSKLAGARASVAQMTSALGRAEKGLSEAPPTYANYYAVYSGLASTDATLLGVARAYITAGAGEEGPLGGLFVAIGKQLERVVAHVHVLGVALDVE